MPISTKNRKVSASSLHHTVLVLGGGLVALLSLIVSIVYSSSPYFSTDAVVSSFSNKTLASVISDSELQAISSNLYAALDQVVAGGQGDKPDSVLAQAGRAVMREIRGQLLVEVTRRLASREGIQIALYGWQSISDRPVTVQRQYLEFPGLFSVTVVDATDGTALTELIFARISFTTWSLISVRPHWMRNQGEVILRQIVQLSIQKAMQSDQTTSKP